MSSKGVAVVIAIVGGIAFLIYSNNEKDKRIAQERKNFEIARISTNDPLINLAGCMANHLTPLSEMVMAEAIHDSDINRAVSAEDARSFANVRDALLKECVPTYGRAVDGKYGTLTYPLLHNAMSQVMRADPGVNAHLAMYRSIKEATDSLMVKK